MKALITGASSGIGEQFAYIFAREGYDLVLVARSKQDLQRVAKQCRSYGREVLILAYDLTSAGAVRKVIDQSGAIEVLVNNAGFGVFGDFMDTDWSREKSMIDLNVRVLTQLAKHYAQSMNTGKILNVASVAAFLPGPSMAVYYASKSYVLSFSESLAEELSPDISVTALCPGPTKTGFAQAADAQDSSFFTGDLPTAKDVAEYGYTALMRGRRIAVHGHKNRFLLWLSQLIPRFLLARMIYRRSKQ